MENSDLWRAIAIHLAKNKASLSDDIVLGIAKQILYSPNVQSAGDLLRGLGIGVSNRSFLSKIAPNYDIERVQILSNQGEGFREPEMEQALVQIVKRDLENPDLIRFTDFFDANTNQERGSYEPSGYPREFAKPFGVVSGLTVGLATALVTKDIGVAGLMGTSVAGSVGQFNVLINNNPPTAAYAKDEVLRRSLDGIIGQLKSSEVIKLAPNDPQRPQGFPTIVIKR